MFKKVVHFFDKMEDHVRTALSRQPIIYAIIGGTGVILFWKGIWETAGFFPLLHGVGSIILGMIILLMSGLLVSVFIGDSVILSGLKGEKKLVEKTEEEIADEEHTDKRILEELKIIEKELDHQGKNHCE